MIAQKCREPGCNGTIENGLCVACGAFFDDAPAAASTPSSKSTSSRNSRVSARPSSISAVVGSTSSKRSRASLSFSLSTRRSLGGGLVHIETQPDVEPMKLIRPDLRIPDAQRMCSNPKCVDDKGEPTQLHLDKGFCPKCRTRYSFEQVKAGTIVSGQYEIKGPIAMGGCGFVYMGWDLNVERYVVLKGLINSMDAGAIANAVKEKKFLADLRDPNVVDIVNFVTHEGAQYIVMEFVNGVTLKDLRKSRGPLPVQEAVAYTMGVLPAFEFLHSRKVVYCDFKIENAMVQRDRIRLIDLGGARRIDDLDSDMFMTTGYSAPEADKEVSFSTDLYTVGRTLAVLLLDFDFRKAHRYSLPTPQEADIFARYESLYRFLLRATAQKPDDRFQAAGEMAAQLEGVLREIVAVDSGTAKPAESTVFGLDVRSDATVQAHNSLPTFRVDRTDAAHAMVESALLQRDLARQQAILENARTQHPQSTEVALRLADCFIDQGQLEKTRKLLDDLAQKDAYDWRVIWLRGRAMLAQRRYQDSYPFFDAVFSELPGELAPKLGLALVAELLGDRETAARLYDLVSTVDPGYTTAAFGLARCRAAEADRKAAVEAYARVPALSIAYFTAQMEQVRALIATEPHPPTLADLARAAEILEGVNASSFERFRLEADLFLAAAWLRETKGVAPDSTVGLLGLSFEDAPKLRERAEAALRKAARFASGRGHMLDLVDEANRVRPLTLF